MPIYPYKNTSVLVGIGQRYHVIVEANATHPSEDGNYWIRTWKANCFNFDQSKASPGYETTGILRYNSSSQALPTTSAWENVSLACSDETYTSLVPILPWTVGPAANDKSGQVGQNFSVLAHKTPTIYPLAVFSIGGVDFNPLKIDYSNPTFLNLNYTGKWNPLWVIFSENYTDKDWVSS